MTKEPKRSTRSTITRVCQILGLDADDKEKLSFATNRWLKGLQKKDPTKFDSLKPGMIKEEASRFLVAKGYDHFSAAHQHNHVWPADGKDLVKHVAEIMRLQVSHKKSARRSRQGEVDAVDETEQEDSGTDNDPDDQNWSPGGDTIHVRSPAARIYGTRANARPGMPILPSIEDTLQHDDNDEQGCPTADGSHDPLEARHDQVNHHSMLREKVQKWKSCQHQVFAGIDLRPPSQKKGEDLQSNNIVITGQARKPSTEAITIELPSPTSGERMTLMQIEREHRPSYWSQDETMALDPHLAISDQAHLLEPVSRSKKRALPIHRRGEARLQTKTVHRLHTPIASDDFESDDSAVDRLPIDFGVNQRKWIGREAMGETFQAFVHSLIAQLMELQRRAKGASTLPERKRCEQGAEALNKAIARTFSDPDIWGRAASRNGI